MLGNILRRDADHRRPRLAVEHIGKGDFPVATVRR